MWDWVAHIYRYIYIYNLRPMIQVRLLRKLKQEWKKIGKTKKKKKYFVSPEQQYLLHGPLKIHGLPTPVAVGPFPRLDGSGPHLRIARIYTRQICACMSRTIWSGVRRACKTHPCHRNTGDVGAVSASCCPISLLVCALNCTQPFPPHPHPRPLPHHSFLPIIPLLRPCDLCLCLCLCLCLVPFRTLHKHYVSFLGGSTFPPLGPFVLCFLSRNH